MVQTVPGNTWIDGGEENVAVAKTIHYTADEVKAGGLHLFGQEHFGRRTAQTLSQWESSGHRRPEAAIRSGQDGRRCRLLYTERH